MGSKPIVIDLFQIVSDNSVLLYSQGLFLSRLFSNINKLHQQFPQDWDKMHVKSTDCMFSIVYIPCIKINVVRIWKGKCGGNGNEYGIIRGLYYLNIFYFNENDCLEKILVIIKNSP